MKTITRNKKVWEKPAIDLMNIKRDTFSGSAGEPEGNATNNKTKLSGPVKSRGGRS